MKTINPLFVLLCAISLMFLAIGCDGGSSSSGGGCNGGSSSSSSSSSSSGAMILDQTHAGWQRANCASCHTQDSHNAGLDPYECVACHGDNGATRVSHGNNCQGCHRNVTDHPAASFPYNDSCVICH